MTKTNNHKKKYHISFDIDWAPDIAIQLCLDMLEEKNIKSTFFATHHTDMNLEIVKRGHELGIHPNFMDNSSHGNSLEEIIDTCLAFAPDARYIRTHGLVQSTNLMCEIFKKYPQFEADVSSLMHTAKHVERIQHGFQGICFDKILFNWEDDAEFYKQRFDKDAEHFFGEITIFNFHPIHVYLNSSDGSEYRRLKDKGELSKFTAEEMNPFCNKKVGVKNFFEDVIFSQNKPILLSDL